MKYTTILALWLHFFLVSEEFDRTLPGVWSRHDPDCWIPFDLPLANAHARRKQSQVKEAMAGIPWETLATARREVADVPYQHQKRMLAWLMRDHEVKKAVEDIQWAQ